MTRSPRRFRCRSSTSPNASACGWRATGSKSRRADRHAQRHARKLLSPAADRARDRTARPRCSTIVDADRPDHLRRTDARQGHPLGRARAQDDHHHARTGRCQGDRARPAPSWKWWSMSMPTSCRSTIARASMPRRRSTGSSRMTWSARAYASDPARSRGREFALDGAVTRGPRSAFQRDRDRIIHSIAFRRLRYKTQVFIAPDGDHYRVRLTHSLEVAQIARVIARALGLDEDLTEALCAGARHRPPAVRPCRRGRAGGGARARTAGSITTPTRLRVLMRLESPYCEHDGLNLSWETARRAGQAQRPGRQSRPGRWPSSTRLIRSALRAVAHPGGAGRRAGRRYRL